MQQNLTNGPNRPRDDSAALRAEAGDPATPAERLQMLGDAAETLGRRAVKALASNPSTPPDALAKLVAYAPASFCRNPIAPLIPIEDSTFLYKVSRQGVLGMLRLPHALAAVLFPLAAETEISKWSDLAEAARLHLSLQTEESGDDWRTPIRTYWEDWLRRIDTARDDPHRLFEAVELGILPESLVKRTALKDPQHGETDESLLQRAEIPSSRVATRRHPAPPSDEEERWEEEELPGYADREELRACIRDVFRRRVSAAELEQWQGYEECLDIAIAQSPDAPRWLLARLSRSPFPSVRRTVRRHPAFSDEAHTASYRWTLRQILYVPPCGDRNDNYYYSNDFAWRFVDTPNNTWGGPRSPLSHSDWEDADQYDDLQRIGLIKGRSLSQDWKSAIGLNLLLRFAALHAAPPMLGRSIWWDYAHSPLWQERLAAAVAITAPPNRRSGRPRYTGLLKLLANDGNVLVRAAARARLRGEEFTWEDIPAATP